MPDYRLRIGMKFEYQGKIYSIEQAYIKGIFTIKDLSTGEVSEMKESELLGNLFDGKLELLGDNNQSQQLQTHLEGMRIVDFDQLSEDDPLRLEALRRLHYVSIVLKNKLDGWDEKRLVPVIQSASEQINDSTPPSWVTLYRWLRTYTRAGEDIRTLIPLHRKRGNKKIKHSQKKIDRYSNEVYQKARIVNNLMDETIRTYYLNSSRLTVYSVYEHLKSRIFNENYIRTVDEQLPIPHFSSVYRRIELLDQFEVDRSRYGRRYANEKHRAVGAGPHPTHPLERVESDHTKLDLMVVDTETRLPLGRPWLTVILDVYSRTIHGVYLSFHHPGYLSVMKCLRHAIKPKDYVKKTFPTIENDWPNYGLPELMFVDNGREFHSKHLKDACTQLGIQLDHAPPNCPWYKGTVERWFGTQNTKLLHELPGTTFSNIMERGDYDPQKNAVISFDALLEMIHHWIIDLYHQDTQSGLIGIPFHRWNDVISEWPPNLPRNLKDLDVLIGLFEERHISKSGIQLNSLRYNGPELSIIRRQLEKTGEKAQLKYDPDDLSVINVRDPESGEYVRVYALDQEYTRKLTLFQHKIIKRLALSLTNGQLNPAALCRAKKRMEEIVTKERVTQDSIRKRQKAARYKNLGQPDYSEVKEEGEASEFSTTENNKDKKSLLKTPNKKSQAVKTLQDNVDQDTDDMQSLEETGWEVEYISLKSRGGSNE